MTDDPDIWGMIIGFGMFLGAIVWAILDLRRKRRAYRKAAELWLAEAQKLEAEDRKREEEGTP